MLIELYVFLINYNSWFQIIDYSLEAQVHTETLWFYALHHVASQS